MITIRLMGGMGNQMFQYAMGRASALAHDTNLSLEVSSFDNDPMRSYSLGLWKGIKAPITKDPGDGLILKEEGMPYNLNLIYRIANNSYLWGFWQTEKYFSNIRQILQDEFLPKSPPTPNALLTQQQILTSGYRSVFLTVRRTDYTKSDYHGILPMEYYLEACKIIANKVEDPHFFVFSDEPEWVKQHFKLPYEMTIGGNFDQTTNKHLGREDEELWLMSQCKHAVMANSSYSWWGAWLNPSYDRIVIAPKRWFLNSNEDPRDIVPERWLRI